MVPTPPQLSPALKALATLPTDHEVFKQMEFVVRLIQHCEQQDEVASSTARRLLRSIYDAANRAVQHALHGDAEIDISLVYLETFVALLKRFDQLQLVHRLKDVVTIWIVSASYLALNPQTNAQETKSQQQALLEKNSLDFRLFPMEVAAHSSLVLATAWKYGLLQLSVIDTDFLSILMKQAMDAVRTDGAELSAATRKAAEVTIELVLTMVYALTIDLGPQAAAQLVHTQRLVAELSSSLEQDDASSPFVWLRQTRLALPKLLEFQDQAASEGWTISELVNRIETISASNNTNRILTIQALLAYRTQSGVTTYTPLPPPAPIDQETDKQTDFPSLNQAFQNNQLKSKQALSSAIA
eukprot:Protomagalhaensia_wolfi_Nauph_80__1475@NODE_1893_length_1288_cov_6_597278_g1481_i0_p1_GENE_NODE_1893_length_1288_cov_6_597278_g1481_i0NODE_1893_length_1288_cov_6_597278_g1481_i0_p1_ORF_typecomplete_len389_score92_18_NODE_1893_length_1288_cov_6_597278_g1481_i01001167